MITISLYRIAQEALTNAAKHAGATQVRLELAMRADESHLRRRRWTGTIPSKVRDGPARHARARRSLTGPVSFEAGRNGGAGCAS